MTVKTDKFPEFIIWCFCFAILCRLGGCGEKGHILKEQLDRIEQKIDNLTTPTNKASEG